MQADVVAGGHVFHAEVAAVSTKEVRFNLVAELEADPALPVTLVLAVYKFDRMEWVIEKATELGVATIAPVIAHRTEKHLAHAAEKRAERWRRIAHEAAQQSRRSDVPIIHDPIPLATRVREASDATRIVLAEQERTTTLRNALDEAVAAAEADMPTLEIAIGPEGGWRLRKKRSSTPTAGAPHRLAPASCAPRQPPSPRSRWWLLAWSRY